jgi:hypothetical protein
MRRLFYRSISFVALTTIALAELAGCGGGSSTPTVAVTASASTLDPGQSTTLTATLTHDDGQGVTWSLSGGGTLTNQSATGVTYTAPATETASTSVTVTATSVKDTGVTASATISINASPTITTAAGALAAGQVGTAYSATLAASGGVAPYTWSVSQGSLPAGLTLSSSAGTITGTPTAPGGTATFSVKLSDSDSVTAVSNFSIAIAPAPAIAFTTTALANATYNTAYTASVSATGGAGTLTYALASGSLPVGLSLSATGAITGTPAAGGTSTFTVKASDAFGDSATSGSLAIDVTYPTLSITTATTLPAGIVGTAYSQTLAASGGSGSGYTYSVTSGTALSATGLTLSSAGSITGTPSASESAATVTVQVTDSASNKATAQFTLTVYPALSIAPSTLPFGIVGTPYTTALAATGGSGSGYTFSVTSGSGLSAVGLALSSSGAITGTPTASESAVAVTIQVADSLGYKASSTFSITVYPSFAITTSSLPSGIVGTVYSQTLAASGGSGTGYSYSVTSGNGLSAVGLSLSSAGVISGTPKASETAGSVTIQVTDSLNNKASATFSLTVYPTLSITTSSLPSGIVGTAYSTTLAAIGGSGGYTFTVSSGTALSAAGLTLAGSGTISGTPTASETSAAVTVQVADSAGNRSTASFTLTIYPSFGITTASLPSGIVGTVYSQTLAASGGSGTGYTYSVTSGTGLSAVGLTLSSSGVISGTPTASETAGSVTIQVTDSLNNKASSTFSLTIYPSLSITTSSLPNGFVGTAYSTTLAATGGSGSYTFTVSSGTALSAAGLTLSGSGAISGTPTASETSAPLKVQVADSAGNKATANLTLTIYATFSITTTSVPSGILGKPYSATIVASGGSGSGYSYTVTSGTGLSAVGLTLSPGGSISGTPTATENSGTFTVQATDSAANKTSAQFTLTVNPLLAITTTSIPNATVGTAYSTALAATGGTGSGYIWSLTAGSSSLTGVGLSLSSSGVISGTPTGPEAASGFTVQVADSAGNKASTSLGIIVNYATLSITTTNLPSATVGSSYSQTFNATGGSGHYSWSITSGLSALQNIGMGFSTAGVLSGTPNNGTNGSYSFTVQVTDTTTTLTSSAPYTFLVNSATALACSHDGSGNSLLKGNYAFLLAGYDPSGNKYDEIGDFAADGNGNITSGNGDANSSGFATTGEQQFSFTGTYSIGSTDKRGIANWTSSESVKTAYCFAADSVTSIGGSNIAESGRIIEADGSGYLLTGFFQIQDPADFTNSAVTGGYAFGMQGVNTGSAGLSRAGIAGVISFDGAGNITAGQADIANYDSSTSSTDYKAAQTLGSGGTYSVSSSGRGTMTLAGTPFVFYVVGTGGKLLMLTADNVNTGTLLSGQAIQQTTTNFTTANAKASAVFRSSGNDPSASPATDDVEVGQIVFDGAGNVTALVDENDGGTVTGPQAQSANYSVTSIGYLTLTNTGKHAPAFYLYAPGSGFGLAGNQSVPLSYLQAQTVPSGGFSSSSVSGSYAVGTITPAAYNSGGTQQYPQLLSATVSFSGGTLSITSDNVNAPGLASDVGVDQTQTNTWALDPTYGATTGRFVAQNSGQTGVIGYIVNSTTVFLINATAGQDGLALQADHQ